MAGRVINMTDMDVTDLAQRLREAMNASVASARPSFNAVDIRHRHRRHQRLVTIASVATAVAVLLTAIVVRASLHGLSAPPPVSPRLTGRYVDPSFGWRIRFPRTWVFAHIRRQELIADGFRLTNFAPDLKLDTRNMTCLPRCAGPRLPGPPMPGRFIAPQMGWLKAFPADGVAVQVWYSTLAQSMSLHDSAFPVSAASFRRMQIFGKPLGPEPFFRTIYGDGLEFDAAVWTGPRASGTDVRAAWAAVRSLRFSALTTGTTWRGLYYVLGPATRYPVGSVTAIPVASLPKGFDQPFGVYLIHASRGFYAIDVNYYGMSRSIQCSVTFDPRSRQFSCPGKGWRWNIMGLRVGVPPQVTINLGEQLFLGAVTVAHDGHVLFTPDYSGFVGDPAQTNNYYWG
jgi:hypothetical protein